MAIYKSIYGATYLPPVAPPSASLIAPDPDSCHRQWRTMRQFPIIPIGPHRPVRRELPLGPGIGTKNLDTVSFLDPKDIVNTEPPGQMVTRPPPSSSQSKPPRAVELPRLTGRRGRTRRYYPHDMMNLIGDINCDDLRWITTSQQTSEHVQPPQPQVVPPSSTFEKNADQVKYRPQRYESAAEVWQSVGTYWDKCQSRARIDSIRSLKPAHSSPWPSKQLINRGPEVGNREETETRIVDLIRDDNLAPPYERPCPGYAGFKPRLPIEAVLECSDHPMDEIKTLMKQSYKIYAKDDFLKTKYPHLGPMSREVTLTYPYNPFNKVEKEELCILTHKNRKII